MHVKLTWQFVIRYVFMYHTLQFGNIFKHALQNIGPVWKALCCMMMGVPVPIQALNNILEEQRLWEQHRVQRSRKENIHKRYKFMHH